MHVLRRRPRGRPLGCGVPEVRPQPPRRGQAARLRRDVLDQGAARRRRRRDRRHLPRARATARQGLRGLGLGHGLRPGDQARRAAARAAEAAGAVMRTVFLLIAVLGLVACGESEQVVVYEQGKYKGKKDGLPWDNEPVVTELRGSKWTKIGRAHV